MEQNILIGGFGGQGVVMAGNIIANAGLIEGKNILGMVSYGAEVRGGTCKCMIVVSEGEICSPVVDNPDIVLIFNTPSFDRYIDLVREGGIAIINSSIVHKKTDRKDITVIEIPFTDAAIGMGNVKVANSIAVGSLIKKTGIVNVESAVKALETSFKGAKKDLVYINTAAIHRGAELV